MFGSLFVRLMAIPMLGAGRSTRLFWAGILATQGLMLLAAAVWLIAPIAIWHAIGAWWMLLWLVPTCVATFSMAYARPGGG